MTDKNIRRSDKLVKRCIHLDDDLWAWLEGEATRYGMGRNVYIRYVLKTIKEKAGAKKV
jgi:hypothetical protein